MPFSTELQPLSLLQAVRAEGVQFIQRVCVYRKVKLFRCRVVVVWLVQKPQPQWKIDGRDIYLIERSIPPYPLDKLCSEVKQHKDRQHCFGKENLHAEITVFQPFSSPQCKRCLNVKSALHLCCICVGKEVYTIVISLFPFFHSLCAVLFQCALEHSSFH